MFTYSKLASLNSRLRAKKLITLWNEREKLILSGSNPQAEDDVYYQGILELTKSLLDLQNTCESEPLYKISDLRSLRQQLLDYLGISLADWNLQTPGDTQQLQTRQFPFEVFLEDLRSPFNVGSILRTAEAYGFSKAYLTPGTPDPDHPRAQRSAMGTSLPWQCQSLELLKNVWGNKPVFALELGGTPVKDFQFPLNQQAIVLLGNEEFGLTKEALAWADSSFGRVTLPLYGQKSSLNVGVSFGILASWWTAKNCE